jgi:hypothetical protein
MSDSENAFGIKLPSLFTRDTGKQAEVIVLDSLLSANGLKLALVTMFV